MINPIASPDEFLRNLFGYSKPGRNDCGYSGRYDLEDTSRMHGWGPAEGEGACDYPASCPQRNGCNFYRKEGEEIENT